MKQIKNWLSELKNHPFFIRLLHWEYWPLWIVYFPVAVYHAFLSLKARSFFYFTAANPGIPMGGLLGESKRNLINQIPEKYRPKTLSVPANSNWENVIDQLQQSEINFPIIAKPDIGERGFLVEKINDENSLLQHLHNHPVDFVIQEFIDYPVEVSVLHYRKKGYNKGIISSFTYKVYLTVEGNGVHTISELMMQNQRAILQLKRLEQNRQDLLTKIPAKGQIIELVPLGNHSRGAMFLDINHLIDQQLTEVFDKINEELKDIYFCRYDIKCQSIDDLKKGKAFKILEINGIKSEPTHIYDPSFPLLKAWRTLFRQWRTIYEISIYHHHQYNFKYTGFIEGLKEIRKYFNYMNKHQ